MQRKAFQILHKPGFLKRLGRYPIIMGENHSFPDSTFT